MSFWSNPVKSVSHAIGGALSATAAPFNQAASSLTGGKVGGKQGLSLKNIAGDVRNAVNNPLINPMGATTSAITGGKVTPMDLAGAGAIAGGGYLAAPYMGFGAPAATGTSDAALMADPVLAGDAAGGGAAWAPATGGGAYATDAATAPAVATASGGAATKAGMSTAQKIALGLMGANAVMTKKQGLNPTLTGAAQPAQNTSNNLLDQFNKGQLNAADQYNIAKWAQDSKAHKQQYYAQAGLSDSSMAQQDIAGIDAQATAMRDQALNNYLTEASQAAGISNPLLTNAVNLQIQQDQQAQQAQQQFFEMLAFTAA